MSHTPEHDRWLEQALAGSGHVPDEMARELRACELCAPAWDESVRLQADLDRAGGRRREVLATARAIRGAPGEARVGQWFHDQAGREASRRHSRGSRPLWLLAIAAALLVVAFLGRGLLTREAPAGYRVLGADVEVVAPGERTSREGLRFAWRGVSIEDPRYRVVVEGRAGPDAGWARVGGTPQPLRTTEWQPDPDVVATWPDVVRWRVAAYPAHGEDEVANSGWSQVSLSR